MLAGAPTFAVCAGLQLLAAAFLDADGQPTAGLGLLDVDCGRLDAPRRGRGRRSSRSGSRAPTLTGYENHRGTARLGPGARPLGSIVAGVGNGDGLTEGVQQGTVVATYLHGPALVRNPWLADELLARAAGPLSPYDDGRSTSCGPSASPPPTLAGDGLRRLLHR